MDKMSKQNLRLKELKDLRSSSEEDVEHQTLEQKEREGVEEEEEEDYDFQNNKAMLQQILQYKLVSNRIAALRYVNSFQFYDDLRLWVCAMVFIGH